MDAVDHHRHFWKVAFRRVQHLEKGLVNRIDFQGEEDLLDCCCFAGVVGDNGDARKKMDFGFRCEDHNIPVVVVLQDTMMRFASVAVVAAVAVDLDSSRMPRRAASGIGVAHLVELQDIEKNTDLVALVALVSRRDLSWRMDHHWGRHMVVVVGGSNA